MKSIRNLSLVCGKLFPHQFHVCSYHMSILGVGPAMCAFRSLSHTKGTFAPIHRFTSCDLSCIAQYKRKKLLLLGWGSEESYLNGILVDNFVGAPLGMACLFGNSSCFGKVEGAWYLTLCYPTILRFQFCGIISSWRPVVTLPILCSK